MTTERMPMRKIREILRLKHACGLSKRQIAASAGVGASTVSDYLKRAERAGLAWPLPTEMSDSALEIKLFPPPTQIPASERALPDWAIIHRELKRPDVTLALLWDEYRGKAPEGYGYSWFCDLYRAWSSRLKPSMRQVHIAGDKIFVDFAGRTLDIIDPITGEVHEAQVFVAVLGASSYTYAEVVWSQKLPDWIGAHVRAFKYFNGASRLVVPDNLKSGVIKACFYDPQIQHTYNDMLRHYGSAALPARPVKPKDKAKVEVGVQIVQRWILARLRNHKFFSLVESNNLVQELLVVLNNRVMRHIGMSRKALYEEIELPALQKLPQGAYMYAEWKHCGVGIDYHIEIDKHYYSVPYTLMRQELEARITSATIEVFHRSKLVASHLRAPGRGSTTVREHMPSSHQRYHDWTLERIQRDAARIGPAAAALVSAILTSKPHPEQGFRSVVGILQLTKRFGDERLEAACERALTIGARTYSSVKSIINNGLERAFQKPVSDAGTRNHENIRGKGYYH